MPAHKRAGGLPACRWFEHESMGWYAHINFAPVVTFHRYPDIPFLDHFGTIFTSHYDIL